MNKTMRGTLLLCCAAALFLSAGGASSGGAEPDAAVDGALKPRPPYVALPGEKADWIVKIIPPKEPAPAPASEVPASAPGNSAAVPAAPDDTDASELSEIRVIRAGDLQRSIVVRANGASTEYYHLKGFNLTPTTDKTGKVMVSRQNASLPPYPYFSKGFYGVGWIRPESFVGVTTYKEIRCFHYKGRQANPLAQEKDLPAEAAGKAAATQPAEAWLDCKTQLPVAVSIDGNLLEFVHNPAEKQLEMPPPYLAAWKFHENQARRLNAIGVVR